MNLQDNNSLVTPPTINNVCMMILVRFPKLTPSITLSRETRIGI
jgi:hypothetical protein